MSEALSKPAKLRLVMFALITIACVFAATGILKLIQDRGSLTTNSRSTTLATATALESAANSFFTEYGALPDVGSRVKTDTPEGVRLLAILLGLEENTDKLQNPRRIKFLSVREGKNRRNGLIYNLAGNRPEGLFDKWGNPYSVELDDQYKEHLHFTIGSRVVDLKGRRAAAYSPGADRKLGTEDDVRTW